MVVKRCLKHIRNIVYLLVILFLLLCIMILYQTYSAQIPFKMVLFVMSIQLVLFLIARFRVQVKFYTINEKLLHQYQTDLAVNIVKHGIFPYKKIEFTLKYKNEYDDDFTTEKYKIDLKEGSNIRERIRLSDLKCGIYEVHIEHMVIYDMFGFASIGVRKKNYTQNLEFVVMPATYDVKIEPDKLQYMTEEEATEYFTDSDEMSDYKIREFMNGDKLNKIHWKLTSKKDEIMVISDEAASEPFVYITFDLKNREMIHAMYEDCYSQCEKLVYMGLVFYVAWEEMGYGSMILKRKQVRDISTLNQTVVHMMTVTRG